MVVQSVLPGAVSGSAGATVAADGSFSTGPVASTTDVSRPNVSLWLDLAAQPTLVMTAIGPQGENLRGELVRPGEQKVVCFEAAVNLGDLAGVEAQLREIADVVRRCQIARRQINKMHRRIQEAKPRLRTIRQLQGFESQIAPGREKTQKDLADLPDWSSKTYLLDANPDAGRERLLKIIEEFPDTAAAEAAATTLDELEERK